MGGTEILADNFFFGVHDGSTRKKRFKVMSNEELTAKQQELENKNLNKSRQGVKVFNRLLEYIVQSAMDELPIEQSRSQPVNPSHVTINGLSHYCTHNASVNNSI